MEVYDTHYPRGEWSSKVCKWKGTITRRRSREDKIEEEWCEGNNDLDRCSKIPLGTSYFLEEENQKYVWSLEEIVWK